jgi:hypothetical protein
MSGVIKIRPWAPNPANDFPLAVPGTETTFVIDGETFVKRKLTTPVATSTPASSASQASDATPPPSVDPLPGLRAMCLHLCRHLDAYEIEMLAAVLGKNEIRPSMARLIGQSQEASLRTLMVHCKALEAVRKCSSSKETTDVE